MPAPPEDPTSTALDGVFAAPVTRRGLILGAGALLLAACGSDGDAKGDTTTPDAATALSVAVGSSALAVGPNPQRFSFSAQRGTEFLHTRDVTIRFRPPGGEWTTPGPAVLHTEGMRAGMTLYTTDVTLDRVGTAQEPWQAEITADGSKATTVFLVAETSVEPAVGQAAPRAASPTTADALGVDPICTRTPACPLHAVSLDTVIGTGKPVALMFATPARCQSQLCAPSLDQLLAVMGPYEDRVTFVHVEIYKGKTGPELTPTVSAWKLQAEPFFYGIDGGGTVVARLDGAFAQDEVQAIVRQLAGS